MADNKADIAVIGLAVMGQNLVLNMNDHGVRVVAYNRTQSKVSEFIKGLAADTLIQGANSLEDMLAKLSSPRKVMLMVKAGEVVDAYIEQLLPLLDDGDVIIDGGNSDYRDTARRVESLSEKNIHYLGIGVSGGEEGARYGPSIMPGGDERAWPLVKPIFQAIAARTDAGEICCDWVGSGGAGHFVKMVHNGIEYGDMQLISEAYHFMKSGLNLNHPEMQKSFSAWNKTELDSYLVEITANILGFYEDGQPLVESILDTAGQKGTGKLTANSALENGVPLSLISESVFARYISSFKEERIAAETAFAREISSVGGDKDDWLEALRESLLASKIISYAQGFMLMKQVSNNLDWNLNFGNIALMWRGGCIIRSRFLENIRDAFIKNPELSFLGIDDYFQQLLKQSLPSWRRVLGKAIEIGLPMQCTASGLSFFDAFTCGRLPANMLQAQRDYFGAHTYERVDRDRGEFFHTDWIGSGGAVSSSQYNA
ncbi:MULTISPECIES: decarboxylating NADP(+)-dependent phosphogluconate dehydrogenase [unclassified Oleiphilus]|jgi:6-phosphogluconate dehydrogenase|nr:MULTISPECIES: decarboxylating NADP(+)-dependent phosphogluconate dehydrogenase [unclassified Oleiphilus]KZY43340.1 phosphogluconate dehydrogenase (NADP(+)-dependent, decarboxylating) [Oleiphilus sp. HI0050]KZY76201.1 phosphogluconate dehydrogenase (NADP(+)-dependent, decarboxylating) [Oleiphilus sp. HI0068]KZY77887.1 phosphogluconate dehydrogenase (NADP(+)-dependent, decarboxylating) [Oleiphilus sp. HI0069]KZY87988.1 phosphogluconate dehydrogenase (NADP(+)-dependent, decarboxylating) [Oleiph